MYKRLGFYLIIGLCFVLAGLLMNSGRLLGRLENHASQPFFSSPAASADTPSTTPAPASFISGEPAHIDIPSVNISVDVEPGVFNTKSQTWSLSLTKAEYATVTPLPNNSNGNTFIYGHNRTAVFSRLLNVRAGDEAVITTANHHVFTYKMVSRQDTSPSDLSLFKYQGPPILTLQTCSGLWYQHRSLFVFEQIKAV